MKRLNWLTLKSFAGPAVMSLLIILFILVLQFLGVYREEIAGKGLGLAVIGKLFMYASGKLSLNALPVAVLAGALMTFGALGENNELAAMKSTGISLLRVARSLLVLSVFIAALSLWFSFEIMPLSNLKFFRLLYDVGRKKAELSLQPGHFYTDIDGYVIRVSGRHPVNRTLYDVMIYHHAEGSSPMAVISADSARLKGDPRRLDILNMVMYHGVRHEEIQEKGANSPRMPYGRTYFDSLNYKFRLKGFSLEETNEKLFSNHYLTLSQRQLRDALDSLERGKRDNYQKFEGYLFPYTRVDSNYLQPSSPPPAQADQLPKPEVLEAPEQKKQLKQVAPANPDSLLQETQQRDTTGLILDSFPAKQRVEIVQQTLNSVRTAKNYASFAIKKEDDDQRRIRRHAYEYHSRISLPFMNILFMMIGIALGAIIRKGGLGMPSLISVVLLVVSYALNMQGRKLSKEGVMDAVVAGWLPIIVFAPLAVFLMYKAVLDARLLDEQQWSQLSPANLLARWRQWRKGGSKTEAA